MAKVREFVSSILRRPRRVDAESYAAKLQERHLAPDGSFIPDPVPMAPPIGYKRQPTMVEIVRDMVRGERLRAEAEASGQESFEDADDFDIDEEELLHSQWENDFDPPIRELVEEGRRVVREREASSPRKSDDGSSSSGRDPAPRGAAPDPRAPDSAEGQP